MIRRPMPWARLEQVLWGRGRRSSCPPPPAAVEAAGQSARSVHQSPMIQLMQQQRRYQADRQPPAGLELFHRLSVEQCNASLMTGTPSLFGAARTRARTGRIAPFRRLACGSRRRAEFRCARLRCSCCTNARRCAMAVGRVRAAQNIHDRRDRSRNLSELRGLAWANADGDADSQLPPPDSHLLERRWVVISR
jgi:hypothetical protein